MVTGQLPFGGSHFHAVMYSILHEEPDPITSIRPDCPEGLVRIVSRALVKAPEDRYQAIDEMLVDLRNEREDPDVATEKAPVQEDLSDSLSRALADIHDGSLDSFQPSDPTLFQHTVGREREQKKLAEAYQAACAGTGRFVCVTGEAGIGKSTLLSAFVESVRLQSDAALVARGRSSERLAGTEGYHPILEVIRCLLDEPVGTSINTLLRKLAPTWYVEAVPISLDDASDARVMEDARVGSAERMKRELATFIGELARVRPLVLIFDDLHWADISTVDMLAHIGLQCAHLPMLIVVAYRPADMYQSDNRFEQVKMTLQSKRIATELAIGFLTVENITEYLELEYSPNKFSADLARALHLQTEGSPLFMADLVRGLHEDQVIEQVDGTWVLHQTISAIKRTLPDSIRSTIERKISHLDERDLRLLTVGSVQGQSFHSAIVADVLNMESFEAEERLERLAKVHGFVHLADEVELRDGTLTMSCDFVHVLYQNTLFDGLSMSRRASMAVSVAKSIERFRSDDVEAVAGELAFLYETGRRFAEAADYYAMAAGLEIRSHAVWEAIALYRKSLTCADKHKGPENANRVLRLASQLGDILGGIGDIDGAMESFARAESAAIAGGHKEGHVSVLCGRAMALFAVKRTDEMRDWAEQARAIAEEDGFDLGVAHANALLAMERMSQGELDEAQLLYGKAVPVIQEQGSSVEAALPASYQGFIHAWRSEFEPQRALHGWALERLRTSGQPFVVAQGLFLKGVAAGNEGRIREAFNLLHEGYELAEKNIVRNMASRLPNTLGWLHSEFQDIKTAEVFNRKSIELAQSFADLEAEANARVNLAHDYMMEGALDQAHEELEIASALYEKDVWFRWKYRMRTQAEFANYWTLCGDMEKAHEHAGRTLEAADEKKARKYMAYSRQILGNIASHEERHDEARRYYAEALQILQHYPCPFVEWKTFKSASELEKALHNDVASDEYRGRALAIIHSLADQLQDQALRDGFLGSRMVRELG
jgi:tetratricopeptide (TPR) repeat protein